MAAKNHLQELIREYMEKRGVTQVELAKRTGRAQPTISVFLSGRLTKSDEYLPYIGLRKSPSGDKPIAFAIRDALGIPKGRFSDAILADNAARAQEQVRRALRAQNTCSVHSLSDLRNRGRQKALRYTEHTKRVQVPARRAVGR